MEDKFFTLTMGLEEQCRDITNALSGLVSEMGLWNGHIHVQQEHTTCALTYNENESGLKQDFLDRLEKFAPRSQKEYSKGGLNYYRHDDTTIRTENKEPSGRECRNGDAHVKAMITDKSPMSLRVREGKIYLGQWQRILFFDYDLDCPRKERTISMSVINGVGEAT